MDFLNKHRKAERIGRMNQQIALQSFTETVNAYGERVEVWTTAATVWAAVEYQPLRSKEGEQAGQEQAMLAVMFHIRARTVDEKYRVVYDGRTYDIVAVMKSNDRQYVTLVCKQIDQ